MGLEMQRLLCIAVVAALTACAPPDLTNDSAVDAASDALEKEADNVLALANATLAEGDALATASGNAGSGWTYTESEDKMRGGVTKIARVNAMEPIRLSFPYGESTPTLNVRQDTKWGFDIFLTANGQFLCRTYNDDTISVKFDTGPIREWACADADGGSSDVLFVRESKRFLTEIKKAKEVTIEAPMYEAGRQQMTFRLAGLKW